MKSTGIIRRIDDIGRICIPSGIRKEIFGTAEQAVGQPMEFYVEGKNIVLRKYTHKLSYQELQDNYEKLQDKFIRENNVVYEGQDEADAILCPLCKCELARNDDDVLMRPRHCPECGCRLKY